jgi:hypothetical protein
MGGGEPWSMGAREARPMLVQDLGESQGHGWWIRGPGSSRGLRGPWPHWPRSDAGKPAWA